MHASQPELKVGPSNVFSFTRRRYFGCFLNSVFYYGDFLCYDLLSGSTGLDDHRDALSKQCISSYRAVN